MVNGMQHFLGMGRTGRVSIYSVHSTSQSEIDGRAGIDGTVMIDSDGRWTFNPE